VHSCLVPGVLHQMASVTCEEPLPLCRGCLSFGACGSGELMGLLASILSIQPAPRRYASLLTPQRDRSTMLSAHSVSPLDAVACTKGWRLPAAGQFRWLSCLHLVHVSPDEPSPTHHMYSCALCVGSSNLELCCQVTQTCNAPCVPEMPYSIAVQPCQRRHVALMACRRCGGM
jgi:hypothetical protein